LISRLFPVVGSLALYVSILVACASGPPVLPFTEGPTSRVELQRFQADVTGRHGVRCRNSGELELTCEPKSRGPDWTFTLPGHPAHPAVSASIWVWYQTPQGQAIRIDRTGQYGGDKQAYEAWKVQLVAHDKQTLETVDEMAFVK
jgi:hypothetical protein